MDLLKFLDEAVTPWHTSSAISNELLQAGFQELSETEMWNLQRGKSYFVIEVRPCLRSVFLLYYLQKRVFVWRPLIRIFRR